MRRPRAEPLVAAAVTLSLVAAMAIGRFALGTPLIPELIAQQVCGLVTPQLSTTMIRLLGFGAKWVAFALAIAGCFGGGVGLGWFYFWLLGRQRRSASGWSGRLSWKGSKPSPLTKICYVCLHRQSDRRRAHRQCRVEGGSSANAPRDSPAPTSGAQSRLA